MGLEEEEDCTVFAGVDPFSSSSLISTCGVAVAKPRVGVSCVANLLLPD